MRDKRALIFIGVVIFALTILRFFYLDSLSTEGFTLQELRGEIQEQKEKNDVLRQEILRRSSLRTIEQKARQAGFVDQTNYLILK